MFQFENIEAFLSMGGHGPYVWSAYVISLVTMVWLVVAPLRQQRVLLAEIRKRIQTDRNRGEN